MHEVVPRYLSFCFAISIATSIFNPGCATTSQVERSQGAATHPFLQLLKAHPEKIWAQELSPQAKQALSLYEAHARLDNGYIYGNSVRHIHLKNLCLDEIENQLAQRSCVRKEDVLKDPKTHEALRDSRGKTVLMLVYLCPDGGVVRIKPQGDPTSRFRPQPHSSKSLRFPYNSKFDSFDDEIVKVDEQGLATPKWAKDLNSSVTSEENKKAFIEDWANDAHTDLRLDCPT